MRCGALYKTFANESIIVVGVVGESPVTGVGGGRGREGVSPVDKGFIVQTVERRIDLAMNVE